MKSKEEILRTHLGSIWSHQDFDALGKYVYAAMDEYASQQAPAMYTRAIGIIKKLAEWSWEYPRETIYSTSNKKMDDELVSIEKEAMQFIKSLK